MTRSMKRLLAQTLVALLVFGAHAIVASAQVAPAKTIRADKLWEPPYNLHGEGIGMAIIESGGRPQLTHPRLAKGTGAATFVQKTVGAVIDDHATAVAGIIGGNGGGGITTTGLSDSSKVYLYSHVFQPSGAAAVVTDLNLESFFKSFFLMWATEDQTLWRISTHSYGSADRAGWQVWDSLGTLHWLWYGVPGSQTQYSDSSIADPKFGWYGPLANQLDLFCTYFPEQIAVFSAGNANGNGPDVGTTYYRRAGPNGVVQRLSNQSSIPRKNGSGGGFDCLEGFKTAKNGIMVGAVVNSNGNWVRASFSSAGPTDDGRIKPDVMALGDNMTVLQINGTVVDGGTSYAAPAVAGALAQLTQLWNRSNANPMHSATARLLLCHTARDLGRPGPDYHYGWGLVDAKAAADLLLLRAADARFSVQERSLKNGARDTIYIKAPASSKVKVTIAWTDPARDPVPTHPNGVPRMDDTTHALMNDLDMRVFKMTGTSDNTPAGTTHPYELDRVNRTNNATRRDNDVDNIEQVVLTAPSSFTSTVKGVYMIVVSHKGTLRDRAGKLDYETSQKYSIAISGASEYFAGPRFIVSSQVGQSGSHVSWRPVPNATMYDVQYKAAGAANWQTKGTVTSPAVDFASMQQGPWLVRVRAGRGSVDGSWSDPAVFVIGTPQAPTGTYASNITSNSAVLNWDGVPGATGYRVAYVPVRYNGELLWNDYAYKTTTSTKLEIKNLPPDEYIIWFVQTQVAPSGKSDWTDASEFNTYLVCNSYEPGNDTYDGARLARMDEWFNGLICKNDLVDYYKINPLESAGDRYLQLSFEPHSKPFKVVMYGRKKGVGNPYSILPGTSMTLSPTEERSVTYNQLDFANYDYWIEVKSASPATVYSDNEKYMFWIMTNNTSPYGVGEQGAGSGDAVPGVR